MMVNHVSLVLSSKIVRSNKITIIVYGWNMPITICSYFFYGSKSDSWLNMFNIKPCFLLLV